MRSWLFSADLNTPRALLVRHGTDQDVRAALDRGDDGSYDYFKDPRPQWLVRFVSYDCDHDEELAEAEDSMWDYTRRRSELE